jgi:hypothetical protein
MTGIGFWQYRSNVWTLETLSVTFWSTNVSCIFDVTKKNFLSISDIEIKY